MVRTYIECSRVSQISCRNKCGTIVYRTSVFTLRTYLEIHECGILWHCGIILRERNSSAISRQICIRSFIGITYFDGVWVIALQEPQHPFVGKVDFGVFCLGFLNINTFLDHIGVVVRCTCFNIKNTRIIICHLFSCVLFVHGHSVPCATRQVKFHGLRLVNSSRNFKRRCIFRIFVAYIYIVNAIVVKCLEACTFRQFLCAIDSQFLCLVIPYWFFRVESVVFVIYQGSLNLRGHLHGCIFIGRTTRNGFHAIVGDDMEQNSWTESKCFHIGRNRVDL